MRRLIAFENISLDGYIADQNGDMSWAHNQDAEWRAFTQGNASGDGILVFGRITYDLMIRYWPTPMAAKNDPHVAERMNSARKIVVSRTMDKPTWNNTAVIKADLPGEIHKLKSQDGDGMAIMGSGTIVSQLAQERLIDEFQIIVHPVVLGAGTALFAGVTEKAPLRLAGSRAFANGNVLLRYEPA